ncbi:DUF3325 family protein [Shewanella sp. A14]
MILSSFTLTLFAFVTLTLSMRRHFLQLQTLPAPVQYQWLHRRILPREFSLNWLVTCRTVGFTSLILALVICLAGQSLSVGLAYWTGLTTLATLLLSLLLTYRPLWVIPSGLTCFALGVVCSITI